MFPSTIASARHFSANLPSFDFRNDARAERFAPLQGVRVLDLTRVLAGPYCTMILGDLGAEIIKVENPDGGDDTRQWGPPWVGTESAYFLSINRNKKSVAVNMKSKEGSAIVQKLAQQSDVLVENYIPGKLAKMGLDFDSLHQIAPQLIYLSITGYGQTGPYANRGGYDVVAAAQGGLLHITGPQDGDPCRVGVAMTDLSTGLYAYGAIMASLLHRQKTGKGQHIDCNLLDTQIATLSHIASNYLNCGIEAKRWGTGHGSIVPYQAFQTSDGRHFMVGAGNNRLFKELVERMQLYELADDPRFSSNEKRVENRSVLVGILAENFLQKTVSEWEAVFEGATLPYSPVNNMKQVFDDPQVCYSGIVQEFKHPELGKVRVPGPAVHYSEGELTTQCPPPMLGQHTQEVLQGILGYSETEVQQLQDQGVVH